LTVTDARALPGGGRALAAPSGWIVQWAGLIPAGATVLDLAAGGGRHSRFLIGQGHQVTAVDRDISALAPQPGLEILQADLEDGSPWPFADRRFGAIVGVFYLHHPLMPLLIESIESGGVLLYETFMVGNERFGKPSNPNFLLKDGELLELVRGKFSVIAYEARMISDPKMAMVQRIAARRF
jgi:SAM-dependent methyltransferase